MIHPSPFIVHQNAVAQNFLLQKDAVALIAATEASNVLK